MGLFKSNKTMVERAQDERAKLEMKRIKVAQEMADAQLMEVRFKRAQEIRRLRA